MRTLLPTAVFLIILLIATLAIADVRWRAKTAHLVAHLTATAAGLAASPATFSAAHIDTLPAPVARYLCAVLRDGQPIVHRARFAQEGEFLVNPDRNQWGSFTAPQHVTAESPGFVWDARIRMAPGSPPTCAKGSCTKPAP